MTRSPANPAETPSPAAVLDMDEVRIDPAWALRVPPTLARRRRVLPFACVDGEVCVACVNVHDAAALRAVKRFIDQPLRIERVSNESFQRAFTRVFGNAPPAATARTGRVSIDLFGSRTTSGSIDQPAVEAEADDAVGICDELLHAAILRQASDIHLDPERDALRVRFRVDGTLEDYRELPLSSHTGVISRFKVLSSLDIAEKRAPQDGHFSHTPPNSQRAIDIRVATLPTRYGERMTLRLLALQTESLTLNRLGMSDDDLALFDDCLARPQGMMLLTGPTGSGKSTTLYAAIRSLLKLRPLNIVTIEDPVEYDLPGVAQVEVDTTQRVSFERALRSVLRHDPDVVMIGEIRDRQTADTAIKAALTGHLVLSTLHTNSAVSTITRLCDMGIERYLVAATLKLTAAQRLVRRLCDRCRRPRPMTESEAAALHRPHLAGETVYDAAGCLYCVGRGFAGRTGLFEMARINRDWQHAIGQGAEEAELIEKMQHENRPLLIDDAVAKLLAGETTCHEVIAAVTAW